MIANLAKANNLSYAYKKTLNDPNSEAAATIYMIVSPNQKAIESVTSQFDDWVTVGLEKPDSRLWTDSYVNIFQALKY